MSDDTFTARCVRDGEVTGETVEVPYSAVERTVTEFSVSTQGQTVDPDTHRVTGTVLSAEDVMKVRHDGDLVDVRITRSALRQAAKWLPGKKIVKNHVNRDVDAVIGELTDATWSDPELRYEGELSAASPGTVQRVRKGLLDVSLRFHHDPLEEIDPGSDGVREMNFVYPANLSVVVSGRADSNSIEIDDRVPIKMVRP